MPRLLIEWCTNREIRGTRNFLVVRDGVAIFGFHDHPRDFWAADTEFEFVQKLAAEKIIRVGHPPTHAQVAASRRSALGCFLVLGLVAVGLVALALVLWRVAAE